MGVLVVEDHADTCAMLALALQQRGAHVMSAASAAEALTQIKKQWPAVLICDISLPEEDGYELIGKVRALELDLGREIPALALTAHAGHEEHARALAAGFHIYLAKPVEPG